MKPLLCSKPHDGSPCLFQYKVNPSSDVQSSHDLDSHCLFDHLSLLSLSLSVVAMLTSLLVPTFASHGPISSLLAQIKQFSTSYPLQYSCLENLMGRGAWRATVTRSPTSWGHEESDTTEAAEHAHTGRIGRSFLS